MITLSQIHAQLATPSEFHGKAATYASPMVRAMKRRARTDREYSLALGRWRKDGGTVLLRDVLCAPFRDDAAVLAEAAAHGFRDPWWECFTAIDTARARLRPGYATPEAAKEGVQQ